MQCTDRPRVSSLYTASKTKQITKSDEGISASLALCQALGHINEKKKKTHLASRSTWSRGKMPQGHSSVGCTSGSRLWDLFTDREYVEAQSQVMGSVNPEAKACMQHPGH